jgi:hypothetical protein
VTAEARIQAYLDELAQSLRGVSADDVHDIVQELRGHIWERLPEGPQATGARVDEVLGALGGPGDLARAYLRDALLARIERTRSPLRLVQGLLRLASLSAAGAFVLVCSLVGYGLGASLVLCAVLKPLHAETAGLWRLSDGSFSLRLGLGTMPQGSRDLLGWWIVPLGLVAGGGLILATTRVAILCLRGFRGTPPMPRGRKG